MTEKRNVFKCDKCKAIVAVLQGGDGELVCCEEKMKNVSPDEAKSLIFNMQRPEPHRLTNQTNYQLGN